MKVAWAVVWAATWAAWAAAAPTKINDESEESEYPSRNEQAEIFTDSSPASSLHYKRHINAAIQSLAPASGVGLSLPSTHSYSHPASVSRSDVALDLSRLDPAYRMALAQHDPSSLAPSAIFAQELEALEDFIQAGSLSGGVPLSVSAAGPRSYQGDGAEGGAASSPSQVPLQVSQIAGLQGDFTDPQIVSGDIFNLNSGDFHGFQEASLGGGGGLQGDFATFVGTDLLGNTGELQGVSRDFDSSYFGSGGLTGLPLGTEGLKGLHGDSFGAALPLGSRSDAGGYDGVSLSLGTSGGLQGDSYGVSLPLGNNGGPQGRSLSYDGITLPFDNSEGYLSGSGGLDGLQGGSHGVALPLGTSGDLRLGGVSLSDLQAQLGINSAGYVSGGLDGVTLQAAGSDGAGVALPTTATGNVNTGVLLGASGILDVPSGDFGNVGVPLSEAVQLNHFSIDPADVPSGDFSNVGVPLSDAVEFNHFSIDPADVPSGDFSNVGVPLSDAVEFNHFSIDPTEVPGTFTASSFDAASLDSLGQLLSDNVEEIGDPGQSLGSFLMEINGKNGMMVLPASELDSLQNGQLSVAAVANASLLTNYQVSVEVDDDGLLDIDIKDRDANDIEVLPSLATILASTASGSTIDNDLSVSASASSSSSSSATSAATTTTTTTTEGPPRLGTLLPNLMFSKGQFFGTLFGGLTDIAETIYKAITETDWTAPPKPRPYY